MKWVWYMAAVAAAVAVWELVLVPMLPPAQPILPAK